MEPASSSPTSTRRNRSPRQPKSAAAREDTALGVRLDVTSRESWTAALAAVEARWESVSILVNCAGIAGRAAPLWEYGVDEWKQVIDIDLNGVFLGCRSAVPRR